MAPVFLAGAFCRGLVIFGEWPDALTLPGAATVVATGISTLMRERALARRTAVAGRGEKVCNAHDCRAVDKPVNSSYTARTWGNVRLCSAPIAKTEVVMIRAVWP
ncbi:MAG: hypothetical protein ACC646_12275 [Paracoccaceae bacterium]